ncbi:Hint domain-containing protein [Cribrihabitans marinus]|uniref:Hint domain-containing protein n=1 Tax=Cribrihabitans marinus TaxID=1227549 RepID=A0A1H6QL40_9RHOB|nr:Hint domain-containing protein [Cribrihabitans marinus]SEI42686.1 Hint domain-containing protein [Cribrihabitans marinus]
MPVTEYELYLASDLVFSGGTVRLVPGYTGDNDVILTVTDDDNVLDGDLNRNEDGNDTNQFGFAEFADGSTLGGPNFNVYSEEQYTLTAPGSPTITLYRIEMDSDPFSRAGNGDLVGYLPSLPLEPGVTYSFTTSNTVPSNDPTYTEPTGAICFTGGCLIETATGPRPARDLRAGDLVRTRDSGLQPLKWVFRRQVTAGELRHRPDLRPILFEPGALGPNMPERRSWLSPQHRVLARSAHAELLFGEPAVLAPAKGLVNGRSIRVDTPRDGVDYIHLLLERHEILCADGIEAESLDPGAWAMRSMTPQARHELQSLFPYLTTHGFHSYPTVSVREAGILAR